MNCPLCLTPNATPLPVGADQQRYARCGICALHFLDPAQHLAPGDERGRYTMHQTEAADEGYRKFTQPLLERVRDLKPPPARGLDYGAGHQPVLAEYLRQLGYQTEIYDPFFWPDPRPRENEYDFVVACEVVEHFYDPRGEFARLNKLLKPDGVLVVKTEIVKDSTDFANWYYRRDPTHVVFFAEKTFAWIAKHFQVSEARLHDRVFSCRRGRI